MDKDCNNHIKSFYLKIFYFFHNIMSYPLSKIIYTFQIILIMVIEYLFYRYYFFLFNFNQNKNLHFI